MSKCADWLYYATEKRGKKSKKLPNVLLTFFFPFVKEKILASAMESLKQRGRNETKLYEIRHEMHKKMWVQLM